MSIVGLLKRGSSNVRFPSTTPPAEGDYESDVLGLGPSVYLKFAETSGTNFADSSGAGRAGTLNGTGATLGATALAANVAGANTAVNLGSAAWITVPHAVADVALTGTPAVPWGGSTAGIRFVASSTISIWFRFNNLPSAGNKAVIVSKSHTATPGTAASFAETHPAAAALGGTVDGGSFEAYVDSNGALHLEVRSFRGRYARVRTPNGAISAATTYHLTIQLDYAGVTAWLDAAQLEYGIRNVAHVYGLAADIHRIIFRNDYAWSIGKAAWGGQADIQVDEFAVYHHAPSAALSQSNVNTLAQQVSTPAALAHHIWGALTVNESAYANIQAAVDDVNSSGGGTVEISAGSYTENVELKSNVRLKAVGGAVTINGKLTAAQPSVTALTPGTANFLTGDQTLEVTNSVAVGDMVHVLSTLRHDRGWNSASESNNSTVEDGETFEVESATGSIITVVGPGSTYDFASGDQDEINVFTPTKWVAVEGDITFSSSGRPVELNRVAHGRFVNMTSTLTSTGSGDEAWQQSDRSYDIQLIGVTINMAESAPGGFGQDGFRAVSTSHMICKDCVANFGRHAFDTAGNANWGPSNYCESHGITWVSDHLAGGSSSAVGVHGPNSFCAIWNTTANHGGPDLGGWRQDIRFGTFGHSGGADGQIIVNDGAFEGRLEHLFITRPNNWFHEFDGPVSVDDCRFNNVQHSATPTGTIHSVDLNYSGITYRDVDNPDGSWTEV